jgi:hypothetical protein
VNNFYMAVVRVIQIDLKASNYAKYHAKFRVKVRCVLFNRPNLKLTLYY